MSEKKYVSANSCAYEDIIIAIKKAKTGDTIVIPAGCG